MKKQHVIIVLGLGEAYPIYQFLTKAWERKYQIIPHIYIFGWKSKNGSYAQKIQKLITFVRQYGTQDEISLIGVSAGASAALNAYIYLKKEHITIKKYISICGRFNMFAHWWYPLSYGVENNSVFTESVRTVMDNLEFLDQNDYKKMKSFSSFFDEVVPLKASTLSSIKKEIIPFPFHIAIYYLLFFPNKLIQFIKNDNL